MTKPLKVSPINTIKAKKTRIHAALREQVWLRDMGPAFAGKCRICWCQNEITVFNFQCGHRLAESKGGATTLENLTAICGRCNISMATMHIEAWEKLAGNDLNYEDQNSKHKPNWWARLFHCWK